MTLINTKSNINFWSDFCFGLETSTHESLFYRFRSKYLHTHPPPPHTHTPYRDQATHTHTHTHTHKQNNSKQTDKSKRKGSYTTNTHTHFTCFTYNIALSGNHLPFYILFVGDEKSPPPQKQNNKQTNGQNKTKQQQKKEVTTMGKCIIYKYSPDLNSAILTGSSYEYLSLDSANALLALNWRSSP